MPLQSSGEIRLSQIAAELGVTQGEFRLGNFITTAEFPGRKGMKRFHGYTFSTALFEFSSFTFTNAGITGYNGPTLANCLSSYDTGTYSWLNNTSYFNVDRGIQSWTVPTDATYRITVAGAQGGYHSAYTIAGGYGAYFRLDVTLTAETVLKIVVGQAGLYGGS